MVKPTAANRSDMRPAAPSIRLALVTMTDAPSVTYATVVGTGASVVVVAVVSGRADVGAVVENGVSVVEVEAESSSSSPPHAPSRRIPVATAANDSSAGRARRRD